MSLCGRARETEDYLLRALLARLLASALDDERNVGAYHAAVGRYPATTLLCAYETARNLPAMLVRKSRGAYFTFLLKELDRRGRVEPRAEDEPATPTRFVRLAEPASLTEAAGRRAGGPPEERSAPAAPSS